MIGTLVLQYLYVKKQTWTWNSLDLRLFNSWFHQSVFPLTNPLAIIGSTIRGHQWRDPSPPEVNGINWYQILSFPIMRIHKWYKKNKFECYSCIFCFSAPKYITIHVCRWNHEFSVQFPSFSFIFPNVVSYEVMIHESQESVRQSFVSKQLPKTTMINPHKTAIPRPWNPHRVVLNHSIYRHISYPPKTLVNMVNLEIFEST